jgi:hypothetical protein
MWWGFKDAFLKKLSPSSPGILREYYRLQGVVFTSPQQLPVSISHKHI